MLNMPHKKEEPENNYCKVSRKTYVRTEHHIYLNERIREPHYYFELLEILRMSDETDEIYIHINNGGGNVTTAVQIMNEIQNSEATVHTIINGEASSSAALIFLSGNVYHVLPGSYMLCHWFSTGSVGKGAEIKSHIDFSDRHWKKVFGKIFEGFLTTEEFDKMAEGVDYWLDDEEICERLKGRTKHYKKAEKAKKVRKKKVINKGKKIK